MRYTIGDGDYRRRPVYQPRAAAPLPPVPRPEPNCAMCAGSGWVQLIPPQSCSHPRGCVECLEADEGVCPDCQGTGARKCDECGEFDATELVEGDAVCSICADARRRIA